MISHMLSARLVRGCGQYAKDAEKILVRTPVRWLGRSTSSLSESTSGALASSAHYRRALPTPLPQLSSTHAFAMGAAMATAVPRVTYCRAMSTSAQQHEIILYQYEVCPFCCKVKAFLDYHNIPYKVVEVNPLSKKEMKFTDYNKVPLVMVDGKELRNSTDIISELADMTGVVAKSSSEEEEKWRKWVDDRLVHLLSPNIYRTGSEALEAFDYITTHGNFSTVERLSAKYAGAFLMYMVSMKLKKKYNIEKEREELYEAADHWIDALEGKLFLGGEAPNLADLAVFGVLRSIHGLRSFEDMQANSKIGEWYARMEGAVGESSRVNPPTPGQA